MPGYAASILSHGKVGKVSGLSIASQGRLSETIGLLVKILVAACVFVRDRVYRTVLYECL